MCVESVTAGSCQGSGMEGFGDGAPVQGMGTKDIAYYYAALLPRRGRILRRTLSVCLSVRPSVPLSLPSVTSRHLAN